MTSSGVFSSLLPPLVCCCGGLLESLLSFVAHLVWLQLPRLLRSFVGFLAAGGMEELAGAWWAALEALGLNGSLKERTCQVAIRTLRATAALAGLALPWRCLVSL